MLRRLLILLCFSLYSTGRQTPVSGLCGHDGGDTRLHAQTEADSALFCHLPSECAEVYGTFVTREAFYFGWRLKLPARDTFALSVTELSLTETLRDQSNGGAHVEGCDSVLRLRH